MYRFSSAFHAEHAPSHVRLQVPAPHVPGHCCFLRLLLLHHPLLGRGPSPATDISARTIPTAASTLSLSLSLSLYFRTGLVMIPKEPFFGTAALDGSLIASAFAAGPPAAATPAHDWSGRTGLRWDGCVGLGGGAVPIGPYFGSILRPDSALLPGGVRLHAEEVAPEEDWCRSPRPTVEAARHQLPH